MPKVGSVFKPIKALRLIKKKFNKKERSVLWIYFSFFIYNCWLRTTTNDHMFQHQVLDRFSKKMLNSIITKVRKVFGLKCQAIIKIYIDCSIYVFLYIIHVHIRHCRTTHSHCVQQKKSNQAVDCFVFFQTHSLAEDDHRLAYVSTPADVKPSVSQLMLELIQSRWA